MASIDGVFDVMFTQLVRKIAARHSKPTRNLCLSAVGNFQRTLNHCFFQRCQEISKVVEKVLEMFPGRLKIRKVPAIEGQRQRFGADLTVYWQSPTRDVKERVRRGAASFQDVMQVQIETWTREIPQTFTAASMYQECLL